MRTIVVACDGSRWAQRALQLACELADGGPVIAVNCAEGTSSRDKAEQKRILEHAQQLAAERGAIRVVIAALELLG